MDRYRSMTLIGIRAWILHLGLFSMPSILGDFGKLVHLSLDFVRYPSLTIIVLNSCLVISLFNRSSSSNTTCSQGWITFSLQSTPYEWNVCFAHGQITKSAKRWWLNFLASNPPNCGESFGFFGFAYKSKIAPDHCSQEIESSLEC